MSESQEPFLIGVDGGGTGCRAAIAHTDGQIVAQVEGGRANVATEFDLAVRNVADAIQNAAHKAGISQKKLQSASVHIGLAGVMSKDIADRVANALPYQIVTVTDDRATAVEGALGDEDGYLMSVGTGTIVATRKADELNYVCGWGFAVSDQASGAWLGRRLLEQTLLCYDQIATHSPLTQTTLAKFGNDPNGLVAFSLDAKPGDFGQFAPDIICAANAGDLTGLDLVNEGASYLQSALRALRFREGDRLCISGGVGRHYQPFLDTEFTQNIVDPAGSSIMGAIWLAAESALERKQVAQ
jgi:glucosamine kinase